ncbi:sulfatase [Nocardioides caeni]|uniref:Sulfatase n=1 Tax=Nocardioides caeni TaxID=574700 RepID=A0A4S8MZN0_9ACTN|nr:sulfatase [Nocardioides caeni]THV08903.1 sulfatase [Nocardioides caeni]
MTRGRRLWAAATLLTLVLAACSGDPASEPAPTGGEGDDRVRAPAAAAAPNVLLVMADDMRADELQWMPKTRRQLGARGLEFLNSFAPNPLCCPARASLLTGKYSHNHRVLSHEAPYGFGAFDDSTTLATSLQAAGYRTALVGKYLNGYGEQPTYDGDDSLLYVPPGWNQWYGSTDHVFAPGESPGGGTYHYFDLTSNINGELVNFAGQYSTDVTGQQTRDLIRRFAAAEDGAPWFVWWNPVAPHHGGPAEPDDPGTVPRADGFGVKWLTPARPASVQGRFDDAITHGLGMPADGIAEEDVSDKPAYVRSFPQFTQREVEVLTEVSRQRAEALSVLDDQMARTLRMLRRVPGGEDTVVVFTSDNGYYLGEHRKRQGKINLHEPSIRVPFLIAGPEVPRGVRHDPVTVQDLATTIAAWARADLPAVDGTDIRPVLRDGDRGWTRPVLLEGLMPESTYLNAKGRPAGMGDLDTMGLRLGRWKFVIYSTGEVEAYDLQADPLELESLAWGADDATLTALHELWQAYATCAGDACRRPLADEWVAGTDLNRAITVGQRAAVAAEYGQG